MPEDIKTRAIVAGSMRFSESDLIVTFVTEGHGIIKGIAKGALRSRKRFVGSLEPFTLIELACTVKDSGGLARVDAADIVYPYYGIREGLDRINAGAAILELVTKMEGGGGEAADTFQLLEGALKLLEKSDGAASLCAVFFLRYLEISGFSPRAGGLPVRLSPGALAFIEKAAMAEGSDMGLLTLSGTLKDEIFRFLDVYTASVIGRKMKTLRAVTNG